MLNEGVVVVVVKRLKVKVNDMANRLKVKEGGIREKRHAQSVTRVTASPPARDQKAVTGNHK